MFSICFPYDEIPIKHNLSACLFARAYIFIKLIHTNDVRGNPSIADVLLQNFKFTIFAPNWGI